MPCSDLLLLSFLYFIGTSYMVYKYLDNDELSVVKLHCDKNMQTERKGRKGGKKKHNDILYLPSIILLLHQLASVLGEQSFNALL